MKDIWLKCLSNKYGHLAQGNNYGVKATDTIDFIYKHEVPKNKKVTYGNFVLDIRPFKTEQHHICLTMTLVLNFSPKKIQAILLILFEIKECLPSLFIGKVLTSVDSILTGTMIKITWMFICPTTFKRLLNI